MTNITPATPPPDPNATVVSIQFSRTQFYTLIGVVAIGYLALIGIIYGGITDDIKEVKNAVVKLSDSYREAFTSGIKVNELLVKAPTLEQQITETRIDVKILKEGMEPLKPVPERVPAIKAQLDDMQYQIHQIPGMHK